MPRRQIQGSNLTLFAGPSPATGVHTTANIKELYGVTSFSYDISESREDTPIFGVAAAPRITLDPPTVTADFTYYVSNLDNEKSLGFNVGGVSGAFVDIRNGTKDEKNYFLAIAGDGVDAVGSSPATTPVLGLGNGTINSWNFSAAVGSVPTATVSITAIDAAYYADSTAEVVPAIDTSTGAASTQLFTLPVASGNVFGGRDAVLRPRDISVDISGLTGLFYDVNAACVQSVDFGVDFGREGQVCLGSFYRQASAIANTVPVTLSVEFLAKDMIPARLSQFTCQTGLYSATTTIRRPNCSGTGAIATRFVVRGLSFDSLNYSADADTAASTVTLGFSANLGGANDLVNGIFMSGIANT